MAEGLALSVNGLEVTSDTGRTLLSVPELTCAPGKSLGIRGPSGAGKSTLLYALAGLSARARGAVRWGETDMLGLAEAERAAFRARHMGMIFQDFLLFDELGAQANAGLAAMFAPKGARAEIMTRAETELSALGLADKPRAVATYSGGERQRVAVARALANDAGVLLADEPTAALHRQAADALTADLVARAKAGLTLIVVSHDEALLSQLDRVVTIADGTLVKEPA